MLSRPGAPGGQRIWDSAGKLLLYGTVFLVFLAPLLRLLLMSFTGDHGATLGNYAKLFSEPRTMESIGNTIIVGGSVTAFAVLCGSVLAVLVAYTNVKRKRLLEVLVLLPFIVPSYIITLSWTGFLSAGGGVGALLSRAGVGPVNLYSMGGIIFVLGLCNTPIVYINLKIMLQRIPRDMEWACRASGYTKWQTLRRINLAQAAPAIASGAILSFLASIDNFSVPAFLGTSSKVTVLSTYIYEKAIGFGPSSFRDAAALSVILSSIAIAGILLERVFVKRTSGFESIKEDTSVRIEFSPWSRFIVEWGLFATLVTVNIVPIVFMFMSSVQRTFGLGYGRNNLTLQNFRDILTNAGIMRSVRNSLFLATVTCVLCIIIGTVVAYIKVRKKSRVMEAVEKSASMTYAIPGMVLALAMIFHWVEPLPGIRPGIYGTINILIVAYVTRYIILQIRGSSNAILTVEPALEEAAMASGSCRFSMWRKIIAPLLAKPVLNSAFLVFVPAVTELTLSSILAAAGTKTIGLTIFNLQQAGDYNLSTAMSAVVVLLIIGCYGTAAFQKYVSCHARRRTANEPRYRSYIPSVRSDESA